jgi:hypothetical protein
MKNVLDVVRTPNSHLQSYFNFIGVCFKGPVKVQQVYFICVILNASVVEPEPEPEPEP